MPPPPEAGLYLGQILGGRYEVKSFIAPGGFCLIFEGYDRATGDAVAVKILHPAVAGSGVEEFETEGQLLEGFRNASNVIDLLHRGTDNIHVRTAVSPALIPLPVRYLILELADACLVELVINRASLSWIDRLTLFRGVVLGVHQMHLKRTVHRDMKSENALVTTGTHNEVVCKVADLGRSRALADLARFPAELYQQGRGDFRFAPPEMLWGQGFDNATQFRRADVYLLGSVLFELATGQGVTALALGNGPAIAASMASLAPDVRKQEYQRRKAEIRARYEMPLALFGTEVPKVIRHDASQLMRQLCDADPELREHRFRADKPDIWGLEWLLRRVDIMLTRLRVSERRPSYRRKVI